MKKWICLLIALLMLPTALACENENCYLTLPEGKVSEGDALTATHRGSWLPLRAKATPSAKVIDRLPPGAGMVFTGDNRNGYISVRYGENEGYVDLDSVQPQSIAAKVVKRTALRAGPGSSSRSLSTLGTGTLVLRVGEIGPKYTKVRCGDRLGYVLTGALRPAVASDGVQLFATECERYVSLRETPGTSADRLLKVPRRAMVRSFGSAGNGFDYVCYKGQFGFIRSDLLTEAPCRDGEALRVVNCREYVSLRQEPSAAGRRIRTIPLGARVIYRGDVESGFALVSYGGDWGYVSACYLSI